MLLLRLFWASFLKFFVSQRNLIWGISSSISFYVNSGWHKRFFKKVSSAYQIARFTDVNGQLSLKMLNDILTWFKLALNKIDPEDTFSLK